MRRLLVLLSTLLIATMVLVVIRGFHDDPQSAARGLTAGDLPFPRSATPLPVPEVRIAEPPWTDSLERSDVVATPAQGFWQRSSNCPDWTWVPEPPARGVRPVPACEAD